MTDTQESAPIFASVPKSKHIEAILRSPVPTVRDIEAAARRRRPRRAK